MRHSGWVVVILMVLVSVVMAQDRELLFAPAEVESMLFLYNQAPIKGTDVEVVAPLGAKLREGLQIARTQPDSLKPVKLMVSPNDVQICLSILNNSTFEARFAELVLGMKKKLEALAPAMMAPAVSPVPPVKK